MLGIITITIILVAIVWGYYAKGMDSEDWPPRDEEGRFVKYIREEPYRDIHGRFVGFYTHSQLKRDIENGKIKLKSELVFDKI